MPTVRVDPADAAQVRIVTELVEAARRVDDPTGCPEDEADTEARLRYGWDLHPHRVELYLPEGSDEPVALLDTDHPTRDGTGIRDYIHVWDLARAHVAAVERFDSVLEQEGAPSSILNLGTGQGVTVRELLHTFEDVFGRPVPTVDAPPRPGDAVGAFANVDKASRVLGWTSELTLADGIESSLAWMDKRHEVLGYP